MKLGPFQINLRRLGIFVAIGILLAAALIRWRRRLPTLPEGDVVVVLDASVRAGAAVGTIGGRLDALLGRWPVAAMSLLGLVLTFAALVAAGRV